MRLIGMRLIGMRLIGMRLIGMCPIGMRLIGMCLIEMRLIGNGERIMTPVGSWHTRWGIAYCACVGARNMRLGNR